MEEKETELSHSTGGGQAKLYEAAYLISPALDLEGAQNLNQTVKNAVQDLSGLIEEEGELSQRRLAYEIGGFRDGYLAHFKFNLAADKLEEFKKHLAQKDVLRFLLVASRRVKPKTAADFIRKPRPARPAPPLEVIQKPQDAPRPAADVAEIDKKLEEILGK